MRWLVSVGADAVRHDCIDVPPVRIVRRAGVAWTLAAASLRIPPTAVLLRLRVTENARVHRYDGVPEWLRCT
ncbi:hypothetical protein PV375_09665 [Gulosibacter sp. GYB002]|uniref:hypothetical protein n=1 Tax=Gulosibacter sp. GYB002 TaxID=2994391 RepID=UPI002F96B0DD